MALAPDDDPRGMSGCATVCLIISGLLIVIVAVVAFLLWNTSAAVAPFIYTL